MILQSLEVIRFEGHGVMLSVMKKLFYICNGVDQNAVGACSELIFAPIGEMFPDDAPLLPSGIRIIPLDTKRDTSTSHRTLDLASSLEVGLPTNHGTGDASRNTSNTRRQHMEKCLCWTTLFN